MKNPYARLPHHWDTAINSLRENRHLTAVVLIGILSFLIFYLLFGQISNDNYLREIVSALIATILTVTITTFLLKSQSESEEAKERNVELLRRKIDAYSLFVDCYLDCMDEDGMNEEDAKNIRKQIYHISLFSSSETVQNAAQLVRGALLEDVDHLYLKDVIQNFRDELHLDISEDPLGDELVAIDMLLSIGFDKLDQFKETMHSCDQVSEMLQKSFLDNDFGLELRSKYGSHDLITFSFASKFGILYETMVTYPDDRHARSLPLMLKISFDDEDQFFSLSAAKEIEALAVERGYEWPDLEDLSVPSFNTLVSEYSLCKCPDNVPRRKTKEGLTLDRGKLFDIVASEINAFETELQSCGKFSFKGE